MCKYVSKKWKEEKERREAAFLKLMEDKERKEEIKNRGKYCSFLKNTLVPRTVRYKFHLTLNNDKWNYLKSKVSIIKPRWMTHNELVSCLIYSIYFCLRFGYIVLTGEEDLELQYESRNNLLFIFDFFVIYYFFNSYLYQFYIYNKNFRNFIYSYFLDSNYNNSYFDLYNYYIYPHVSSFFIFLNIGSIKLEHDKVITPTDKWFKIPLLELKFFDYSEYTTEVYDNAKAVAAEALRLIHYYPDDPEDPWPKKRWKVFAWPSDMHPWEIEGENDNIIKDNDKDNSIINISDNSLLNYQDNMFFSFCIYEFYLDFKYYFSNIFNSDFFHLLSIFPSNIRKNKPIDTIYKDKTYLSKVSYNDILKDKTSKKEYFGEMFPKGYNELSLLLLDVNRNKLDYYKSMMSLRSFMIKIPYLFFLLYTWYTICYRNARYNLYVRSFFFFEEFTSKKFFFLFHNNPYGHNKTKMYYFKFQKLWFLDHLKFYIEERFFNKWFLFYSTRSFPLSIVFKNDVLDNKYCFNNLLNSNNLNLLLKINELKKGYNSESFSYIYEFYYDTLLRFLDSKILTEGWKLMMRVRQCKFLRRFKLGASSYLRLREINTAMYTLPYDIIFFYDSINELLSFDLLLDLYNDKFLNYYFLKDFYNLNDKISLKKNFKMVNFFNKLKYLSFYIADPYFVKFFYKKYLIRRLRRLRRLKRFYRWNIIYAGIKRNNNKSKIFNYDYFHHYLNWRTDTSTFVQSNYFFKDLISSSFSISNMIVKSRFLNLVDKVQLILNYNNIFHIQKIQRFIVLMKDFYFQLLNESIDTILYMFFLDINKFISLQNNVSIWLHMSNVIDSNLLYRSYVCYLLFEFNYYVDWFFNRSKRVLWIYHKKDYREHEGILFYKDKYKEIF